MRWKGICAYDGTNLLGWQSQIGGLTIQDILEAKLQQIFGKAIRVHGSGRTDSGVHAKGQVFHFDADWKYSAEKLHKAISSGLGEDIQIVHLEKVPEDFHARFSVKGKRYVYYIHKGYALPTETRYCWSLGMKSLNVEKMRSAARILLGKHDFSAFGANARGGDGSDPVKDIWRLDIIEKGDHLQMITEGSGYLYKMVRSFAGALVDVGLGNLSETELKELLESKRRTRKIRTAPAKGLFLDEVFY